MATSNELVDFLNNIDRLTFINTPAVGTSGNLTNVLGLLQASPRSNPLEPLPSYLTQAEIDGLQDASSAVRINTFIRVLQRRGMPQTLDDFLAVYNALISRYPNISSINVTKAQILSNLTALYNQSSQASAIASITGTAVDTTTQMYAAFANFLQNYPFPSNMTMVSFMNELGKYFSQTVDISMNTNTSNIEQSYEGIYLSVFGNTDGFDEFFKNFYDQRVAQNGFFLPSQGLADWVGQVFTQYNLGATGTAGSFRTSSSTASTAKVSILNSILFLLIEMINSLQNVAAAQSDRLTLLAKWQAAYTDLTAKVKFFSVGDGSAIDGTKSDDQLASSDRYFESGTSTVWMKAFTNGGGADYYMGFDGNFDNGYWKAASGVFQGNIWDNTLAKASALAPYLWKVNQRYPNNDLPGNTFSLSSLTGGAYTLAGVWVDPEGDHGNSDYSVPGNARMIFVENSNGNIWVEISPGQFKAFDIRPTSSVTTFDKIYQSGGPSWLGDEGKKRMTGARTDANARAQNWIQQLQAYRSIVTDQAKSLQSNLNQSTDSANQQASLIDNILQQLSSLLAAIFR